jgi:hypothetical protein
MANVKLFKDMTNSEREFCFAFKYLTDNADGLYENYDLCRGYSGRAMYGKECFGYTTDEDYPNPYLMIIFGNPRWDNMGLGRVFYWPQITWHNELIAEDEDVLALEYAVNNDVEDDPDLTDDWEAFMEEYEEKIRL